MVNIITQNAVTGLQQASGNVAKSADKIVNAGDSAAVVEDLVDIKINENNFKANALVLETAQDMQDTLLRALDIEV